MVILQKMLKNNTQSDYVKNATGLLFQQDMNPFGWKHASASP